MMWFYFLLFLLDNYRLFVLLSFSNSPNVSVKKQIFFFFTPNLESIDLGTDFYITSSSYITVC